MVLESQRKSQSGEGEMEPTVQKSLDRIISQRAVQMSSSSSCKIWVVGFLCGICITYLLMAAVTSFKNQEFGVAYSALSAAFSHNSSMTSFGTERGPNCSSTTENIGRYTSKESNDDRRIHLLYHAWSSILQGSDNGENKFFSTVGLEQSTVPSAPHLEDCERNVEMSEKLDRRVGNGSFPPWSVWKGYLGLELLPRDIVESSEQFMFNRQSKSEGAYPPWIVGSDEDNFPFTRLVQRDIWIHQHPLNCNDSNLRFLVADWERQPGFGMGAQFAGMSGLLAIAINEQRVLVTNYYNRADHPGCEGSSRSHWSCYYFPETSQECRNRALELMKNQEAWRNGIVTTKENYTSKEIWSGHTPRRWGMPWNYLQPTTEIDGTLVRNHRKMDRRWWRAQALRYLMRFKSHYTCNLLNIARHEAFGLHAAKMVVESLAPGWPEVTVNISKSEIKQLVWSSHGPWIHRPLLSMHVRMGDKAVEMKVVGFEKYMQLAERIREHFPNLVNIWLSTEMQEVIDMSKLFPKWKFYYTSVSRQVGNSTMASYEANLGRETSTNYPLVNFIMAVEADFFVGALGSTWCFLIDGMRNTGGKVMAGYLSVNKDRFW